jgi:para-nitrobenzyl esterase
MTAAEFYAANKKDLGDLYDKYDFQNLVKVTDENAAATYRTLGTYGLNLSRGIMINRVFGLYMHQLYGPAAGNYYAYVFSRFPPSLPEEAGTIRDSKNMWAWHSSELWYAFSTLDKGIPPARPWTDYDFKLADIMSTYWANFIKTGDPNGGGLPVWPEGDTGAYLDIGDTVVSHNDMDALNQLMREAVLIRYGIALK